MQNVMLIRKLARWHTIHSVIICGQIDAIESLKMALTVRIVRSVLIRL